MPLVTGTVAPTTPPVEKDASVQLAEKAEVQDLALDPVAEKKLIRKCDIRVVPILFVLFLAAFLDRVNIGEWIFGF